MSSGLSIGTFDSLRDWRDYADLVAHVTVVSERAAPEGVDGEEEYYAPRRVTLQVSSVLAARVKDDPRSIELVNDGYMFGHDGSVRPVVLDEGIHVEVGHEYVVGLALSNTRRWGLLSPDSILPVKAGRVVRSEETEIARSQDQRHVEPYLGTSVRDIARRLGAMPPDPVVERYADYGGYARLQLVEADANGDRGLTAEMAPEPVLADDAPTPPAASSSSLPMTTSTTSLPAPTTVAPPSSTTRPRPPEVSTTGSAPISPP